MTSSVSAVFSQRLGSKIPTDNPSWEGTKEESNVVKHCGPPCSASGDMVMYITCLPLNHLWFESKVSLTPCGPWYKVIAFLTEGIRFDVQQHSWPQIHRINYHLKKKKAEVRHSNETLQLLCNCYLFNLMEENLKSFSSMAPVRPVNAGLNDILSTHKITKCNSESRSWTEADRVTCFLR